MNLFTNATQASATKAKSNKPVVAIDYLEEFARIKAFQQSLKSQEDYFGAKVKSQMLDKFAELGSASHRQPENFQGVDGEATASLELRKRSSVSGLNEIEITHCEKYQVPTRAVQDYVINPEHAHVKEYQDEISKLLGKAIESGKLPKDIIQVKNSRVIVTEDSLPKVFQLTDQAVMRAMLEVVGTPAIKAKLTNTRNSMKRAWTWIGEVLGMTDAGEHQPMVMAEKASTLMDELTASVKQEKAKAKSKRKEG